MSRRVVALLLLTVAAPAWAGDRPEKWADPALPVTDGLQLWLDAGRLNAARLARGEKEFADGDKVEIWCDASGRGRDLTQKDAPGPADLPRRRRRPPCSLTATGPTCR